jgi:hypothetical protein
MEKLWGATMTDNEMADRLRLVAAVVTPSQGVRNDVMEVGTDHVVVRSARTGQLRKIPFRDIRNAANVSTNGVIVGVLARVLGLDHGSIEQDSEPEFVPEVSSHDSLIEFYRDAKRWAEANSDWIGPGEKYDLEKLTAQEFLGEYAWAVYVSAFRARTIKKKWDDLRKAWQGFDPSLMNERTRAESLKVIGHAKKADAILSLARMILKETWPKFKSQYCRSANSLGLLPWMGAANRQFVARNLGLEDVGKSDIWLRRVADKFDFEKVDEMLTFISNQVGDGPGLADLYLWAFLSDNPGALRQSELDE